MKKQHITKFLFLFTLVSFAQTIKHDTIVERGKFSIGKIINGKKEGTWKIYLGTSKKNLLLREEGSYKNDKKEGKWTIYESGKVRRIENFKDDYSHGEEIAYFDNGQISFKGNYNNDEPDGQQISYYKNGFIESIENYKMGVENGKFIKYFENGKLEASLNYINGVEEGEFTQYNEEGKTINKGTFKNGKKIGVWIETTHQKATFGSSAMIIEAIIDYTKNTKSVKFYSTNGVLIETGSYIDDEKTGEWLEYRKGKILLLRNYLDGKLNGKWEKYDTSNGKIVESGSYYNNQKKGLWKVNDDFNNLKETGSYINGKKSGEWSYYFTNIYSKKQFISTKETYLEDKLHGKKYYYYNNLSYKYEEYNNDTLIATYYDGKEPMYENGENVGERHWKNNILEKTLKYIIKDNTIVDYEIWKDGKYVGLESDKFKEQYYKIHFKNKCNYIASVLIRYRDDSNNWQTKGWWNLKPNEEVYVQDTKNSIFYYYALDKTGEWKGTDNKTTFQGKEYPLRKKEIKDPLGKTVVNLNCTN